MKYAVELGSGATIYILNLVKIGSDIQKLMDGYKKLMCGYTDTQTARLPHKSSFIFSK
jgi:hypothetical protein